MTETPIQVVGTFPNVESADIFSRALFQLMGLEVFDAAFG